MPIFPNDRSIAINHPILGRGDAFSLVGHMSVELATWLKARLDLHRLIEAESEVEIVSNVGKVFREQKTHEWNMRCLYAAARSYKPALADDRGNLSPVGLELAARIEALFLEHKEKLDFYNNYTFDPNTWTRTDDVLIVGNLTIRQLAMLKLLYVALLDAERTNREELDEDHRTPERAEQLAFGTSRQNQMEALKSLKENNEAAGVQFMDVFYERQENNTPQAFQAIMLESVNKDRVAFVPTSMFGQRARADLSTLTKYGLVDIKAYATGLRGRPKHIVRVSGPGLIVLQDLERKSLI